MVGGVTPHPEVVDRLTDKRGHPDTLFPSLAVEPFFVAFVQANHGPDHRVQIDIIILYDIGLSGFAISRSMYYLAAAKPEAADCCGSFSPRFRAWTPTAWRLS